MGKKTSIIAIITILILAIGSGVLVWKENKLGNREKIEIGQKETTTENEKNKPQDISDDQLVWYDIPELGLRFKVDSKVKEDLIYFYEGDYKGYGVVSFSSKELAKIPGCGAEQGPLTSIAKMKGIPEEYSDVDYIKTRNIKQFNSFFITHDGPQAVCATKYYIEEWKKYFEQNPKFRDWSVEAVKTIQEN